MTKPWAPTVVQVELAGGGGIASATNQATEIARLASILSEVTGAAKDASVMAVSAAVNSLSGGASVGDLAATLATEATAGQIRDALAPLGTEATSQAILAALGPLATSVNVNAVEAAIVALGSTKTLADIVTALLPLTAASTEATQAAILAEFQAQGLDIDASAATLLLIETAVDDLEPDADATRIATESIDTKTLTPLGTDFAAPVRGTATAVAAALPSSSTPRGFTLENIDALADLWVGTDNTVTTANGFRIAPSRSRYFDLGNPNTVWVISATTTAWQIGAVS